jgi:hypothetical protein
VQLYTTYADMGEVPPDRAWSALRALRAAPPGLAKKAERRKVFTSSLEQAEQLFRAAETVGVATKPLLIFYGLSQAGRAIAAAVAVDSWVLSGHGIKIVNTHEQAVQLAELAIKPTRGSFARICEALESSNLSSVARVGDLWPLLNETSRHPLPAAGDSRSLSVSVDYLGGPSGIPTLRVEGLPGSFADVGREHLDLMTGLGANYAAQAEPIDRYLAGYPTLSGRVPFTTAGQPVGLQPHGNGTCSVKFQWADASFATQDLVESFMATIAVRTRGDWRAYPSLDGNSKPVHPLLVWWAILFRLSMLARYEPEAWDALTDVNVSADAVPIEHLLRCAQSSVPELIHGVLTRRTRLS